MNALSRFYSDRRVITAALPAAEQQTIESILGITETVGEDVYDLPEDDRESFSDADSSDTFQSVGVDDYAPTDTVIARNGHNYFATKL